MKRSGIKRNTYRALRFDEPDPPGDPLVYTATDGRRMQRWKIAPRTYVERVVRDESGAPVRDRPMRVKRIDRAEARRRYEAGESLPEIARALDCSTGQLSRALRQMGVAMRVPGDYAAPFDPAVVVERYEAGEGAKSIAASLGVSIDRVRRSLVAAGITIRPAGSVKGRGKRPDGRLGYQAEFEAIRPAVRERSGGRCEARGFAENCSGRGEHVHHRRRRGQGGANTLANLIDVCSFCHAKIHGRPALAYEHGYLVRRGDPEYEALGR